MLNLAIIYVKNTDTGENYSYFKYYLYSLDYLLQMEMTTKSQRLVDRLIVGGVFCGIGLSYFSFFKPNWAFVVIGALFAGICSLVLRRRILTRANIAAEKMIGELGRAFEISNTGFKFSKFKDKVSAKYQWKDIEQIVLRNKSDLVFMFKNSDEKIFGIDVIGYYRLLKNIPSDKLIDAPIKTYQKTTFENLKTCPTCGTIAYKNTKCLSCGTDSFATAEYLETENESDYLREEQLEYFSTMEQGEAVEFYSKKDPTDIFEFDENWKPTVTEKEVIEYSKKEYWDT